MPTMLRPCPQCARLMEGTAYQCPSCAARERSILAPARHEPDSSLFWNGALEGVAQHLHGGIKVLLITAWVLLVLMMLIYEFAKAFVAGPPPPTSPPTPAPGISSVR